MLCSEKEQKLSSQWLFLFCLNFDSFRNFQSFWEFWTKSVIKLYLLSNQSSFKRNPKSPEASIENELAALE